MSATRRRAVDLRSTQKRDDATLGQTAKWKASYATAQGMQMLMDKGRQAREQDTRQRISRAPPPEQAPVLPPRMQTEERKAAVSGSSDASLSQPLCQLARSHLGLLQLNYQFIKEQASRANLAPFDEEAWRRITARLPQKLMQVTHTRDCAENK